VDCSDINSGCPGWASQGFCLESSQYHAWMMANCCASCSSGPAPAPVDPGTCGFVNSPVEVPNSVGRPGEVYRSFIYTEPYRRELFENGLLLRDSRFEQYTQWLTASMERNFPNVDPFNQEALLRRQRDLYVEYFGEDYDTTAWNVMLNGSAGAITKANCVESALWAKQNELNPQSVDESEYGAYILVDRANTTVKIYLQTGTTTSVPWMSWAFDPIASDLSNGFEMLTFLHSHLFFATGGVDCAGTCVPSDSDISAFKSGINRDAQEFWITNGYDSFRMSSSEVGKFTPVATSMAALGAKGVQRERPEGRLDDLLAAKK